MNDKSERKNQENEVGFPIDIKVEKSGNRW